jgi:hypothetical protein
MTIYSNTDLVVITVRSFLLPGLILLKFGLIGFIAYMAVVLAYYKVLKYMFGMECLAMLDEFFLLDSKKNRSNIITVVRLDKIKDYEAFRNFVITRATQYRRTTHYLKKFCSEYFFT